MVACSNGAERIVGKPKYVRVTEADIERWYPNAGAIFYLWMRPYVGRVYDIDAIAALNPDVPATSTWQDFLVDALHTWGLGGSTALSTVADNQIIYWLFLENCECKGDPGGGYTLCGTLGTETVHIADNTPEIHERAYSATNINRVVINWNVTGIYHVDGFYPNVVGYQGATQVYFSSIPSQSVPGTGTHTYDLGVICDSVKLQFGAHTTNPAWACDFTDNASVYCVGVGPPYEPSTPSEPSYTDLPTYTPPTSTTTDDLEVKLDAIISLLSSQHDLVTVTQRQISPFAYIKGTAANVSGSGMVQRDGMVGALVHVNSTAALWSAVSAPDFHMDAGWVSFGTVDGWAPAIRLTHQDQLCFVPSGVVDRLAYYIAPSTSAVITPLLREP